MYSILAGNEDLGNRIYRSSQNMEKNKTTAYFLGKNKSYIKLDLENKQEYIYKEMDDCAPLDRFVFRKLEAHPELFLEEQAISTVYQVRGRGEVPFRRLPWL